MEIGERGGCFCPKGNGGRRIEVPMPSNPGSASSNAGYCATASDYHIELRRYQGQWEYQVISIKKYDVLKEGLAPQLEQCRTEAVSAAKQIAPSVPWDAIEWKPLQAGK